LIVVVVMGVVSSVLSAFVREDLYTLLPLWPTSLYRHMYTEFADMSVGDSECRQEGEKENKRANGLHRQCVCFRVLFLCGVHMVVACMV
jgi:hypothetical protein